MAIDLNKLDQMLNDALNKETSASLNDWLENKTNYSATQEELDNIETTKSIDEIAKEISDKVLKPVVEHFESLSKKSK